MRTNGLFTALARARAGYNQGTAAGVQRDFQAQQNDLNRQNALAIAGTRAEASQPWAPPAFSPVVKIHGFAVRRQAVAVRG